MSTKYFRCVYDDRGYISSRLQKTLFGFCENARRNVDARYFLRPPPLPPVSLPISFICYFFLSLFFYTRHDSRPNLWQISGLPGNFNPREICLVKIFARNINANFASRVIPHCKPNKRHRFRNRMSRCNDHSQRFYVSIDFRIKIQFLRSPSAYLSLNFTFFFFDRAINLIPDEIRFNLRPLDTLIYRCWICQRNVILSRTTGHKIRWIDR